MDIYMRSVHQNEQLIFYFKVHASPAPFIVLANFAFVDAFVVVVSSLLVAAGQRQYKPVPLILDETGNVKNAIIAVISVNVLNSQAILASPGC